MKLYFQYLLPFSKHVLICQHDISLWPSERAVAESFFSSLEKERVQKKIYQTMDEARKDLFYYIEKFYNLMRRHSYLGGVSPEAFERALNSDL
jgi:transposase InsO family protein